MASLIMRQCWHLPGHQQQAWRWHYHYFASLHTRRYAITLNWCCCFRKKHKIKDWSVNSIVIGSFTILNGKTLQRTWSSPGLRAPVNNIIISSMALCTAIANTGASVPRSTTSSSAAWPSALPSPTLGPPWSTTAVAARSTSTPWSTTAAITSPLPFSTPSSKAWPL